MRHLVRRVYVLRRAFAPESCRILPASGAGGKLIDASRLRRYYSRMATITDYIGTVEAAEHLGLSLARIKKLAKDGRVGRLVAGRFLFTRAELDRFAKKERKPGRPKSKA